MQRIRSYLGALCFAWPASAVPEVCANFHGKQTGNREAIAKIKADAAQRTRNLRVIIDHVRAAGVTDCGAMADELNRQTIPTPRGGAWHATSIHRLLARLAA